MKMEYYSQLFVEGWQLCERSRCETHLTVVTGMASAWQQLDLYASMEIPVNNFIHAPHGQPSAVSP